MKIAQPQIIKALVSSIWAKGCMFDDCVCAIMLSDLPRLSLLGGWSHGESHGILLLQM